MEVWRAEVIEGRRPDVITGRNVVLSILLHLGIIGAVCGLGHVCGCTTSKEEEIIPIDLTVVVVENLDGNETEPPPMKKIETPPPEPPRVEKPKPKPKEPEKPKELEKIVTNIVTKVEKKPDPPKVETVRPTKTKEELKREHEKKLADMRARATTTRVTTYEKPQPNGRTDKKTLSDAEIQRLLAAGYKPGRSNQLAAGDEQLGYSLIKMAFEQKWDKPPWTDTLRPMIMRVWFAPGGRIVRYQLESGSGNAQADATILSAAKRVGAIPMLPGGFIEKYKSAGVAVRFTVEAR